MIYVTVGNHNQPFDRLVAYMDTLASDIGADILIQRGVSRHKIDFCQSRDFFPFEEAEKQIKSARMVVSHAGIGTIISAQKHQTPIIITPRRKSFGEHFNDHQLEICEELRKNRRQGVYIAFQPEDIKNLVKKILEEGVKKADKSEDGQTAEKLKNAIKGYIDSI